ncbi:Hypothetical protein A7982_13413 [Minicystis rosea]|nr:Hypothetical protein A7982_13413 [Minicystis rosea]
MLGPYWAQRFGDFMPQIGVSIAVSPSGNIGVLGAFRGTIDFGLGPLEQTEDGFLDTCIVVLDPSGKPLWNRNLRAPAIQGSIPPSLAFAGEDVIVAGSFSTQHPVDFGQGPLASAGGDDVFVARFDAQGALKWSRQLGDGDDQHALDLTTDPQGNAFVSGRFAGTVSFGVASFFGEPGNDNTFLLELNPEGEAVAAAGFPVQGISYGRIAADAHGHVFMTGALLGSADFGMGTLTSPKEHLFAAGYDGDLHPIYTKVLGDPASETPQTPFDLAVDAEGNAIIAAWSNGPIDLGGGALYPNGAHGAFLLKLDPHGNRVWDEALGPELTELHIANDGASGILLAGTVTDSPSTFSLSRFDANGKTLAHRAMSAAEGSIDVRRIAATPAGDLLLVANVDGTIDLGFGPLTSIGPDALVAKLPGE